jgi:surfeit locus 1 family protein
MPQQNPLELSSASEPAHPTAAKKGHGSRLVVLLATIAAIALTASLGRWQLSRASQKQAIAADTASRGQLPVLDNLSLTAAAAEPDAITKGTLRYRRVSLKGTWLIDKTVLLDNRQMEGKPGFYVVTPLQLEGSTAAVLVQRGWLPRQTRDRTAVLPFVTVPGLVTVSGLVTAAPARLYELGTAESGLIRQNLEIDAYAREMQRILLPVSVQQGSSELLASAGQIDPLKRNWPQILSGVDKHYGYAAQWFGLALLIIGLYVWFQLISPKRRAK